MRRPAGATKGGGGTAAAETARRLAASGVEAVALAIVINSGVTLVKTIPLRRFEEAVRFGIGLSPVFTVFQVDDQITSSPHIGGPAGDTRLMPDPARNRRARREPRMGARAGGPARSGG